jgi:hypothetical protein
MHQTSRGMGLRAARKRASRALPRPFRTSRRNKSESALGRPAAAVLGLSALTVASGLAVVAAAPLWATPRPPDCQGVAVACWRTTANSTEGLTSISTNEPIGPPDWGMGLAVQSNPAITGLAAGDYQTAIQAITGDLWTLREAGGGNWSLGMMSGTSPSIAALPGGGYEVAFQSNTGNLWTVGTAGSISWPVGMMSGTSPSIAGLAGGGYEVAFQSNTGTLWTVGSAGDADWSLGMMSGTSPSVAGLAGGGYEVAFQSNAGTLWTVGGPGGGNWSLGMMSGTSPSVAGLAGGGYEVAFQSNAGSLWTVGGPGGGNWSLGMMSGTSPSVTPAVPPAAQGQGAVVSQSDNNYTFEVTNSAGSPARWNPCDSVHYEVVTSGAPAGWQNDISNDISQAANATGLSFVSDGTAASSPSNYDGIVISWASQLTGGDTVGLTTYSYYNTPSFAPQMVAATIQLLSSLTAGGGSGGEQPVLLHELGHALGLAHVNAPEVMNPVDQGYTSYHAGDLNGLTHLGSSQGCSGFYS